MSIFNTADIEVLLKFDRRGFYSSQGHPANAGKAHHNQSAHNKQHTMNVTNSLACTANSIKAGRIAGASKKVLNTDRLTESINKLKALSRYPLPANHTCRALVV